MKREHFGWIVAALLVVVVAAGAMQQQGQVGRFQIVEVTSDFWGGEGRTVEMQKVILLDTVTGESWQRGPLHDAEVWLPFKKHAE